MKFSPPFYSWVKPALLLLAGTTVASDIRAGEAGITEFDMTLAREEAVVTAMDSREFKGRLAGFRDGRLFIGTATDGGEVGYSFAPSEIASLVLPGGELAAGGIELCERGEYQNALPSLNALARQRLRYLPVLTGRQRRPLIAFVQALEATGDPGRALGTARVILPFAEGSHETSVLKDAILKASLELGFEDEARRLAAEWCSDADPAGTTALGWRVLARLAFDGGDFERALWIALQPVAFSTFLPMEHLDACYALAVASAHRLNDNEQAGHLFRDMHGRDVEWPDIPEFSAIRDHYFEGLSAEPEETAGPNPSDEFSAPFARPAEDLGLPLEKVRKIISRPDS